MSQIYRPAEPIYQFVSEIGSAAATLHGGLHPLAMALDKRHNGCRVVGTGAISQLLALVVQDAHLHRLVVVVQTHKYCYSTHDSLLLLKRNLTPAGVLAPAGATSFHPHLWGAQFEGIFENLTAKTNHQGHEGTRRNRVELPRVPSWLVHRPR